MVNVIKDSFTYIAVLIFAAAVLVYLPRLIKGNAARKFFSFAPPVVLIYLGLMALCTVFQLEKSAVIRHAVHYAAALRPS